MHPSCGYRMVEKKATQGPIFGSPAAGTPLRRGSALARRPAIARPPGDGSAARRDPKPKTRRGVFYGAGLWRRTPVRAWQRGDAAQRACAGPGWQGPGEGSTRRVDSDGPRLGRAPYPRNLPLAAAAVPAEPRAPASPGRGGLSNCPLRLEIRIMHVPMARAPAGSGPRFDFQ